MFGIGLTELLIIGLIALLVVGPDKLPELAQKLGRFVWDIRRAWDDVRDTVRTEMMSVQQPFDDLRNAGKNAREALKNELNTIKKDTESTVKQAVDEVKSVAKETSDGGRQTADAEPSAAPSVSEPTTDDRLPATPAEPVAYKPKPAAGPTITYFDLDGNPIAPPEKV